MAKKYTFVVHHACGCGPQNPDGSYSNYHVDLVDVTSLPEQLRDPARLADVRRLPLDSYTWAVIQSPLLLGLAEGTSVSLVIQEPVPAPLKR